MAALRDSEVQIVYLDEDLPDSVDVNDNSDNDDDNDDVGIDEDNNDDDETGEYVNPADYRIASALITPTISKSKSDK